MNDLIGGLLRFVFRLLALAAGLVFALALLAAVAAVAAVWGLRAFWARVTGRPVRPWVMGIDPLAGWRRFNDMAAPKAAPEPSGAERAAARARGIAGAQDDVQDVQARER